MLVVMVVVSLIVVLSLVSGDEDESDWNSDGPRATGTLKFLVVVSTLRIIAAKLHRGL